MHLYNQVHTFECTVYIGGFGHFSVHDERLNVLNAQSILEGIAFQMSL